MIIVIPRRPIWLLIGGVIIVVITTVQNLIFSDGRSKNREALAYGTRVVVAAVKPLEQLSPPGMDASEWRAAMRETRSMLSSVVAQID